MISNNLKKTINDLYTSTPEYVHQIYYGYKITNNQVTNIKSIIFAVYNKKNESELKPDEILPKTITIDNIEYATDVVQIEAMASCLSTCGSSGDSSSDSHRIKHRPLVGGISISDNNTEIQRTGTFGGVVKDLEDNNIVGITNAHVLLDDAFLNSTKDSNILFEYNIKHRRVIQPGISDGGSSSTNGIIGYFKRYYPLSIDGFNKIDACLFSIGYVNKDVSIKQLGLDNTSYLPFATTEEIDSIIDNPKPKLLKSGRTTGFIDSSCNLEAISTIGTLNVGEYDIQNNDSYNLTFSELIVFKYSNNDNYAVNLGDSGSFLLCDFNGTIKIIGLIFAVASSGGTRNLGYACRIDNIQSLLNIDCWTADSTKRFNTKNIWEYLEVPSLSDDVSITQDGKKYWQVGTTVKDGSLHSLYVYYGGIEDEETSKPISTYGSAILDFSCSLPDIIDQPQPTQAPTPEPTPAPTFPPPPPGCNTTFYGFNILPFSGQTFDLEVGEPWNHINLYIAGDQGSSVSIQGYNLNETLTIDNSKFNSLVLDRNSSVLFSDTPANKNTVISGGAFKVQSSNDIGCYAVITTPYAAGGTPLIPKNLLSKYYIIPYPKSSSTDYFADIETTRISHPAVLTTGFGIIASKDNTTVTINIRDSINNIFTSTVSLPNELDMIFKTYDPYSFSNNSIEIISDEDIAVIFHAPLTFLPGGAGNHWFTNIYGYNLFDTNFIVTPTCLSDLQLVAWSPTTSNYNITNPGDILRIISSDNNNTIYYNNVVKTIINNKYDIYTDFNFDEPTIITSDYPISIYQYKKGMRIKLPCSEPEVRPGTESRNTHRCGVGDPSHHLPLPTSKWRSSYILPIPSLGIDNRPNIIDGYRNLPEYYIKIILLTSDLNTFKINNVLLDNTQKSGFVQIGSSLYSVGCIQISDAILTSITRKPASGISVSLVSDHNFYAIVDAYQDFDSYIIGPVPCEISET